MYTSKKPYLYGTGRRKSSVARVRLFPNGTGAIIGFINFALVKVNVNICDSVVSMSQRMGDCISRNVERGCNRSPRVPRPIR